MRDDLILGYSFFSLVLVALVCGHSQACALAATGPVDGAAIETTINPPMARHTPDVATPGQPAAPVLTGNPLWAVPLRSLSITPGRPLFSPSRRPPPPAVVAAPPKPPAPPPPPKPAEPDHPLLTLLGTIVGETQSIAIFVDDVAKNFIRLKTGQDHAGWTLRAIQGREATFAKGQREATVVLPARSATASAPVPVAGRPGDLLRPGTSLPPAPSTWRDGDGQLIAPPPAH
jgi:general secretion pathway protein N